MSDLPAAALALRVARTAPAVVTIALHGELDHDTAHLLTDTVRRTLERRRPAEIRLDCAGLELCDSSGLSAALMAMRQCDAAGTRLRLTNRSEGLDRVLSVTGTADLFDAPAGPAAEAPQSASRGQRRDGSLLTAPDQR